jgi:SAM-dependent methyltransferase
MGTRGTCAADDDPVVLSVHAYSAQADEYARSYAHHKLDMPAKFAGLLDVPSRILDAGCGPGRDLGIFVEHGHDAVGFELNAEFVDMANRRAPTVRGDLREVAEHFLAGSFDGVWAQASLVHLSETETADVVTQFAHLLRPGGRFFTCVRSVGETGWLDEPDGRRWYTVWTPQAFGALVALAGFEVNELHRGSYVEVWATRQRADHSTQVERSSPSL